MVEARSASGRDNHEAAIAAYREAVARAPELADSVAVGLATQLTWAGRYEEAIGEFERALAARPGRIDALLVLALAQAWDDRTADALATYRRALAIDPDHTGARTGEARMLSWLGRSEEAERRYAQVVEADPGRVDARLGLAQVRNWRGDHRGAWRAYSDLIAEGDAPPEAWEGLAQAQSRAGRPDLALATLGELEASGRATASSRALERSIRGQAGWRVSSGVETARDSDEFTTTALRLEVEAPLLYRGQARAGILRNRFDRPGRGPLTDFWLTGAAGYRLSTRILASAAARVAVDFPEGAGETPFEADLGVALLPDDRWRLDLGYSRQALFTFERAPDRVTVDLVSAGATWGARDALSVIASGDRTFHAGGNGRWNLRGRIRHRTLGGKPRLWLEGGGQILDYERWEPIGLWTPDLYRALYARADGELDVHPDVTLLAGIDGGWASERPGPFTPYLAGYGGAVWRVDRVRLEARIGHSDGNLEAGRGYRRTFATLGASAPLF
jgi:tetratricopeptide (TPR) repeat protein